MKKYIICALIFLLGSTTLWAQSGSMTDNQVMQFVVKEHTKGTSNTQIVTKLMQNGVDINQIRRVRKKYQREQKESGLGNISNNTENTSDNCYRTGSLYSVIKCCCDGSCTLFH